MPSAIVIVKRKCKYMHYCAVVGVQHMCPFVATPASATSILNVIWLSALDFLVLIRLHASNNHALQYIHTCPYMQPCFVYIRVYATLASSRSKRFAHALVRAYKN